MRITVITGPYLPTPPAPVCGAVEKIGAALAAEFARSGHKVAIVGRSYPGSSTCEEIHGITYLRCRGHAQTARATLNLLKDFFYSLRLLRIVPQSDVIVTNDFWTPLLLGCLRPGAGRILVCVQRMPKGQLRLYSRAVRFLAASSAVSEAIRREWPRASERTKVVPNPIDTKEFRYVERSRCRGEQVITYTGRIHPEKGLHLLVAAFREVAQRRPGVRLRLVGPTDVAEGGGGASYVEHLRLLASGGPVEFTPAVRDPASLALVLKDAEVFCYPSLAEKGESFGVAPLEAMATGLVPVVSSLECFRDFIEPGVTGFVFDHRAPNAAHLLANALVLVLSDDTLRTNVGRAAAEKASTFSVTAVAGQLLREFDEVVSTETAVHTTRLRRTSKRGSPR